MGDADQKTSVAVLIHAKTQWPEALRAGNALLEAGATVAFYCMGIAPMTIYNPMSDDSCVEWFADTSQVGMGCLSLREIAERLKRCDLVITL